MAVSWLFLMLHTTPWALKPSPHSFSLFSLSLTALSFSLSITYPSIRKPYPLSLNLRRALKHSTLSLSLSLSVPLFAFSPPPSSSVPFRFSDLFRFSEFRQSRTRRRWATARSISPTISSPLSPPIPSEVIWFDLIHSNFD